MAVEMAIPVTLAPDEDRRARAAIFLALFVAYGYFHQGGGWNQTVRFDQARALVETGSLAIDDYLLYVVEVSEAGEVDFRRLLLSDPSTRTRRLAQVNSYDLSVFEGHYYPNKPPGVTLLAALAYAPIYAFERSVGIDAERWRVLTLNAYLTTLFSVGLLGALGGVAFFSLCRALFPGVGAGVLSWATLAYGFGTQVLPYSTMMFDHGPVCAVSIAAFGLLASPRHRRPQAGSAGRLRLAFAGFLAGFAVVLNHAAVLIAGPLLAYALLVARPRREVVWFVLGGLGPAAALLGYQALCFGHPFALPERHQVDFFEAPSASLLGAFERPRLYLLPQLLLQPYRGFLFWSPVLALSCCGLYWMWREPRLRPEVLVIASVGLLYLILNLSFSRWHGGAAVGARYLTPAVPFLALALVPALRRLPRLAALATAVSIALMLIATSVNPMVPGSYRNPLTDYYLPLSLGEELDAGFYRLRGPVSVNPAGIPATGLEIFSPASRFAEWNAFNLGEFLFPRSWASLAPLALAQGALLLWFVAGRRKAR